MPRWHTSTRADRQIAALRVARALLDAPTMKRILLSTALLALASVPAAADTPLHFQLGVKQGADARTYQLVLGEQSCGGISNKANDHEDKIRVCASADPKGGGSRVKVDWTVSSSKTEYRTDFESVIPRGGVIDVGLTGGVRLSLQMT